MKRNIIILIALIVLFAMPVLAKPMVVVTNPNLDEGIVLYECNDEELSTINGGYFLTVVDDTRKGTPDDITTPGYNDAGAGGND